MVVGAFPIAKLGALLLRQLSKPIANYAKERAKSHPFFRKYVCMPPAQFYNWCEIKTKMWLLNLGKPVNVPPLNEAMAIELGANLLGEGILFVIAAAILIIEYNRQVTKQTAKEKLQEEQMDKLHFTVQELCMQIERQEAQIRELFRNVYDLDSRVVKKPWTLGQQKAEDENISQLSNVNKNEQNKGVITKAITYIEKDVFRDDNNRKNDTERSV